MSETQETKVCRRCGQERPIDKYAITRYLTRSHICNTCLAQREKDKNESKKQFWYDCDWIYGKV